MSAARFARWQSSLVVTAMFTSRVAWAELSVATPLPTTCPPPGWFQEEATRRGLGAPAALSLRADGAEIVGEIRFAGGEEPRAREVRSSTCTSVAETLLLIAEVHERPSPASAPSARPLVVPVPSSTPLDVSSPPPAGTDEAPLASPRLAPEAAGAAFREAPEPPLLGVGAAATVDSAVGAGAAWGARAFVRLTPQRTTLLGRGHGWASLALGYAGGGATVAALPIEHRRLQGRVDVVPASLPFGTSGRLGLSFSASVSRLVVRAVTANGVEEARAVADVGLGPRVRFGVASWPLSGELGLDASLAITRRRFVVPEREPPVFRLPPVAFGISFAVATR